MPACSRTRRCLVTAWRVTREPVARPVIDIGPRSHRRETSWSRVASPRAAKTAAEAFALRRTADVLREHFHHHAPTLLIVGEGFGAPLERDGIEAGLGEVEHDPVRRFLERENDEGGRL